MRQSIYPQLKRLLPVLILSVLKSHQKSQLKTMSLYLHLIMNLLHLMNLIAHQKKALIKMMQTLKIVLLKTLIIVIQIKKVITEPLSKVNQQKIILKPLQTMMHKVNQLQRSLLKYLKILKLLNILNSQLLKVGLMTTHQ